MVCCKNVYINNKRQVNQMLHSSPQSYHRPPACLDFEAETFLLLYMGVLKISDEILSVIREGLTTNITTTFWLIFLNTEP